MSASYLTSKDRPGHTTPVAAYERATRLVQLRAARQRLAMEIAALKPRARRRAELELRLKDLTTRELELSNRENHPGGEAMIARSRSEKPVPTFSGSALK